MEDRLVKIDVKQWSLLRDLYKAVGLRTYDRDVAYTDTLSEDPEKLFRLLKLLDFSKGFTFYCTRPKTRLSILKAIEFAGVAIRCDDVNLLYRCAKEKAISFDIEPPTGIKLRPIKDQQDVVKVNRVWPHRTPHTLTFLERLAKYNLSIGAFNDNDELVAWIFRDPVGLLGVLQTDENYFGRGYGKLVTKALANLIAESGDDVCAAIYENNTVSRHLFAGLGFEIIGEVVWIVTT